MGRQIDWVAREGAEKRGTGWGEWLLRFEISDFRFQNGGRGERLGVSPPCASLAVFCDSAVTKNRRDTDS